MLTNLSFLYNVLLLSFIVSCNEVLLELGIDTECERRPGDDRSATWQNKVEVDFFLRAATREYACTLGLCGPPHDLVEFGFGLPWRFYKNS